MKEQRRSAGKSCCPVPDVEQAPPIAAPFGAPGKVHLARRRENASAWPFEILNLEIGNAPT
jgi:hypothetical protein